MPVAQNVHLDDLVTRTNKYSGAEVSYIFQHHTEPVVTATEAWNMWGKYSRFPKTTERCHQKEIYEIEDDCVTSFWTYKATLCLLGQHVHIGIKCQYFLLSWDMQKVSWKLNKNQDTTNQ